MTAESGFPTHPEQLVGTWRRFDLLMQTESGMEKPRIVAEPEWRQSGLRNQLMRCFGFRGG